MNSICSKVEKNGLMSFVFLDKSTKGIHKYVVTSSDRNYDSKTYFSKEFMDNDIKGQKEFIDYFINIVGYVKEKTANEIYQENLEKDNVINVLYENEKVEGFIMHGLVYVYDSAVNENVCIGTEEMCYREFSDIN